MSKKLTIDFVRKSFEKEDYTLLSTEYINNLTKLVYICPKGHKHKITWAMWNSGNRCPVCANKVKIDFNTIMKSFEFENYTILTKEYFNNKQLLNYICPNGNKNYIRWNDWQQGHRCGCDKCRVRYITKKPKRVNIDYIKVIIESEGCILLNDEYYGNRQILSIRLNNGNEYNTTWLSWQQGKRPWRSAKNLQPTIEEIKKSFAAKGYKLLSNKYINSKTKLEFICDRGHKHSMVWPSWKNGHICKFCALEDRRGKSNYKYKSDPSIKVNGVIYKVTNKINKKIYIGQTIQTLHRRKASHFSSANRNKVVNHFHNALNKYGKNNFTWEILEYCSSKEELDEMEFHYIRQYHSLEDGYNMTNGGEGTVGRVCNKSTRRKISESKTGKKATYDTKKKLSKMRSGIKKSKEHISKVVAAKSKYWEITYPDGTVKTIKNLSSFCRNNDLSDRGMWMVSSGIRRHHKGFKCKKVNNTGVTL